MKTPVIFVLGFGMMALMASCVVDPGPGVVTADVGYYTTLPVGYTYPTYFYGDRYYYGGRYDAGRYYHGGRYYDGRYYHRGRYYYGGNFHAGPHGRGHYHRH